MLPSKLDRENARTILQFIVILAEIDREALEEQEKAEREAQRRHQPEAYKRTT